jgi:parallel beta-helix repeat protein
MIVMTVPDCMAATINVPGNYATIQAAINNAVAGDTVTVNSGTYKENVYVNRAVTLKGVDTGDGMPVVDGNGVAAISVTANDVTVQGFNVTNVTVSNFAGICVMRSNAVITDNIVTGNYIGIYLKSPGVNITVAGNLVRNSSCYGILVESSNGNNVTGNTVRYSTMSGIFLMGSNNNVTGNTVYNNSEGIQIRNANGNNVTGNAFYRNTKGISLTAGASGNTLTRNSANDNRYGIYINDGTAVNNVLIGNTVQDNNEGIYISNSASGNRFWLNNFSNTLNQHMNGDGMNYFNASAKVRYAYNGNTYANYIGNYWSDYTGADPDNDGLGNTRHTYLYDYHPIKSAITMPAGFTSNVTEGTAPLTVQFNDTSCGNASSWQWNFGDGTPNSTEQDPVHVFDAISTYTVTLTVTNVAGVVTLEKIDYITALPLPPVVSFTANVTRGITPLCVQFHDMSTNSPTEWLWNFGPYNPIDIVKDPVVIFFTPGNYSIALAASNAGGMNGMHTDDFITVLHQPPTASFTANVTSGNRPLCVQFTDTSSSHWSNATASWQWNFGDGTANSTARNPVHTYTSPGTYAVALTATNDGGNGSINKTDYITVNAAGTGTPGQGGLEDDWYYNGTAPQVTPSVTPTPTPTATPVPTETPSVTPTPEPTAVPTVPVSPTPVPGFSLLAGIVALGAIVAITGKRRQP